jgi:single-stranded-DNA-specific exonuclease
MNHKQWLYPSPDKEKVTELSSALKIHPAIAELLINRDISTPEKAYDFLNPEYSNLIDPFKLRHMTEAIEKIHEAVKKKKNIVIHGDFDADGISSTALLCLFLRDLGAEADYYLPNRLTEGYGLSKEIFNCDRLKNIDLIITVDCGANNTDEIEYFSNRGIDVLVIDHHEINDPDWLDKKNIIMVNPKHPKCPYPFKSLAGVGVVFKVIEAMSNNSTPQTEKYLDLVSLGTIADVSPLTGENRILVKHGLKKLLKTDNLGLFALLELTNLLNKDHLTTYDIAFTLGPRINAAGRLGDAGEVLKLLFAKASVDARISANNLEQKNRRRQKMEAEEIKSVFAQIEKNRHDEDKVIIAAEEAWHIGLIGILASKIKEKYNRPTIVISLDNGRGKGSGRSIPEFDLVKALKACDDLLIEYGGHSLAAGLKIKKDNIELFRKKINQIAGKHLTDEDYAPKLKISAGLNFQEITPPLFEDIKKLQPFGCGNQRPIFMAEDVRIKGEVRLIKDKHIKLLLTQSDKTFPAIGFNMDSKLPFLEENDTFSVAYYPRIQKWQGREYTELQLIDVK